MTDVDAGRFTVAVFQDVVWAEKGIDALKAAGLPAQAQGPALVQVRALASDLVTAVEPAAASTNRETASDCRA